jgi:hypothetical protein
VQWLSTEDARDEYQENLEAAQDCMRRCADADWWEWSDGSRLLFWRWPVRWRTEARDGAKGFHLGTRRPRRHFPPIPVKEPWIIAKDLEKLEKLLRRRYVVPGKFVLAVPRFPVPKGADDIRVVWNLAKNGLNKEMFTPSFFLPTMATYLRCLQTGSYCGDFDIGKQFHNYQLHRAEQVYCGVDVPIELREKLRSEGMPVDGPMRWNRLVFGWQSSPYLALRMLARAIELAKGAPNETRSAFAWHAVRLNLPGSEAYDPGIPRMVKLREDGTPATELVVFFDDGRVIGATEQHAGDGIRQLTPRLQPLGNQDAAQKRRPTSQCPCAWAGGIAYTDQGITRKMLSQTKWDRAKEFLGWIHSSITGGAAIGRQRFRSGKGFLVHVSQTYDFITPYLKGFHLSEDRWRSGRNAEGWLELAAEAAELDDELENEDEDWGLGKEETIEIPSEPRAPDVVIPVPCLQDNVEVLLQFFAPVSLVQLIVRPVMGACYVAYGAGDASGEGFGSSIHPLGMEPLLRQGFWCTEDAEESSNWRKFRNLLDAVQVESDAGRLAGRELWLATDNSTAAFAFSKGASKSRKLYEMVTQLRLMALRGNFVLYIFHISGTRMIQIGVDALSRGELHVGALRATETSAAPLHLSPIQGSPPIRTWVESWTKDNAKIATPEDWVHEAQQAGGANQLYQESQTWVWDLPPAAAIHALEELGNGRLKRHGVLRGVVLIPQLLQPEWSRRFTRVVDFYFVIPAGAIPAWPLNMHEPLTVGLFYLCSGTNRGVGDMSRFWYHWEGRCLVCTRWVTPLQGLFCANFGTFVDGLPTCRNVWCAKCYKPLPGPDFSVFRPSDRDGNPLMSPSEVGDFMHGRMGDPLFCPFECDFCSFFKLHGELPRADEPDHKLLLAYKRRANLDAFWSRRPSTVSGLVRASRNGRHPGTANVCTHGTLQLTVQLGDSGGSWGVDASPKAGAPRGENEVLIRTRGPHGSHQHFRRHSRGRRGRYGLAIRQDTLHSHKSAHGLCLACSLHERL